ncbi:MAG: hypothetical protein OQK09_10715 [Colwellia sp.]|nr:hypothetical protein [Colwellia sp.]MCW8865124.1 hypothetical protein [Colwellia sp.]MCW9081971.1 hypothetical protein [Colwellia sp.]
MCSTPKPKRKIKAKLSSNSVGILATMSSEKRLRFAQRANQASERRIEAQRIKHKKQRHVNKLNTTVSNSSNQKASKHEKQSWLYWLLDAPFSKFMRKLVS